MFEPRFQIGDIIQGYIAYTALDHHYLVEDIKDGEYYLLNCLNDGNIYKTQVQYIDESINVYKKVA